MKFSLPVSFRLVAICIATALLIGCRPERGGRKPAPKGVAAQEWNRLEGCALLPNQWNDGDSFHVRYRGKEYLFRLYFVDTPESENSLPARLADQARYFGTSPVEVMALGKEAAAFTRGELSKRPFTVSTRWHDALGRSRMERFYALVETNGKDLNELLVAHGYARIYGSRVPLPDGRTSQQYLASLRQVEAQAKREHRGGWGIASRRSSSALLSPIELAVVPGK
jgi:endonuclease YncB( thermonuclease family)